MLIARCVCGGDGFRDPEILNGLPIRTCSSCGVMHQAVPMTPDEYVRYYETEYHSEVQHALGRQSYEERYDHDRMVARLRLDDYGPLVGRLLDIGSGNNAFVDECIADAVDAVGLDLGGPLDPARTYIGALKDQNFPTGHFSTITMHDVLEHVPDPVALLTECRRIMADDGRLIVDFPAFWASEGVHHWRPTQHLWMLTLEQLERLLYDTGFNTFETHIPIPSKIVIHAKPKPVVRKRALVLSGIGDIYWTAVGMPGFFRAERVEAPPDVFVWNFDERPRSLEYVERLPFCRAAGYVEHDKHTPEFHEAYIKNGRSVFPGYLGYDWFLSANGKLRNGTTLADTFPHGTDWYPPLFRSLRERAFQAEYANLAPYVLAYVSNHGMFTRWVRAWNEHRLAGMLTKIQREANVRIVFTGSGWDKPFADRVARLVPNALSLVGETDMDQLFGLMRSAAGFVGLCGGNTIVATSLRVPTVMLWSSFFQNQTFFPNCVPPDSVGNWYEPFVVERSHPDQAANAMIKMLRARQEEAA